MPSLWERQRERRRAHILTAAAGSLGERGLPTTAGDDIADATEVAVDTLHNWFESRAALVRGRFDREIAALVKRDEAASPATLLPCSILVARLLLHYSVEQSSPAALRTRADQQVAPAFAGRCPAATKGP
jgi:AcrR family transcriptional regulator